eukprot:TRINITY_DN92227_c0_g1_i1.p1 TRINITY_DN92227_c0_g1~~TRINITY_DN92227_c0_g1_i1.p1  ORF type:complete len:502 (+),score=49.82 TRINITY_DN92227_c0_g1_i1:55-1506(+)
MAPEPCTEPGSPARSCSASGCDVGQLQGTPQGCRNDCHVGDGREVGLLADVHHRYWSISLHSTLTQSVELYQESFGLPRLDRDGNVSIISEEERPLRANLGNWGVAVAVFKGNLGANVLFMAHAWMQSGWAIGLALVTSLAALAVVCVLKLVQCRSLHVSSSYGDLMELVAGRAGRVAVNLSIVLLQSGTGCLMLINAANLLQTVCFPSVEVSTIIFFEGVLIWPFVLIRNLTKLAPVNVLAGLASVSAIFVTLAFLGQELAEHGPRLDEFKPVRGLTGILTCFGTCAFGMEGIGLVMPIYDSATRPRSFPVVYSLTIAAVVAFNSAMAFGGYLAFGFEANTIIPLSLPPGPGPRVAMIAFMVAMLGTYPLQLLPAVRLLEDLVLLPSRPMTCDKHKKNAFRVFLVFVSVSISLAGATSLDHFVSLIGAFCGLPLAYVFPAACHLKLVAKPGSLDAMTDVALILFGSAATVLVTADTVATWGH